MREFDNHIKETAKSRILAIESHLGADVVLFHGPIFPSVEKRFREFIEDLQAENPGRGKILAYSEFITDYINRHDFLFFLHSRRYF